MRIGVLGGTFDPIHNGHLALADAAKKELRLERVYFVPAFSPPFAKGTKAGTPAAARLEMVEAALRGKDSFHVSDMEVNRKGVSYTVDTLREFRVHYPEPHELFLIVGADWSTALGEWKEVEAIFSLCHVVIAERPGFPVNDHWKKQARLLKFGALPISATDIRMRAAQGKPIEDLVPAPVCELIKSRGLYSAQR